ncbi:MAG: threonine/serine exporter family protein [Defluviitaleaceae bacterium]|nr:threonine/serine exporter family protein [Defluviitaleaceae bacterium]
MDKEKILKFAMDASLVMLQNGAETNRVEDTMTRILKNYGFVEIEPFVTSTGMFCTVIDQDGKIFSATKRIAKRGINLEKISLINEMSRKLAEKKIDLEEAIKEVERIRALKPYKNIHKMVATAIACAAFSHIFGGNHIDAAVAFLASLTLFGFIILAGRFNISDFVVNIIGGGISSSVVLMLYRLGFGANVDVAIIGSIMPLIPGVSFTNAVRDVFAGDYLSGTSRLLDSVLVAICIATGVGASLGFWFFVG